MTPEFAGVDNDHDVVVVDHLPALEAEGCLCFGSANTCMGANQHVRPAAGVAVALAPATRRTTWAAAPARGR
eukprot:1958032-Pyramimonas_sp.AAC.1